MSDNQDNAEKSEEMEKTYWNGEPCKARKVVVVIGKALLATHWHAPLEGTERNAVLVEYHDETILLDNENGDGWDKVTKAFGSPNCAHSELPLSSEIIKDDGISFDNARIESLLIYKWYLLDVPHVDISESKTIILAASPDPMIGTAVARSMWVTSELELHEQRAMAKHIVELHNASLNITD